MVENGYFRCAAVIWQGTWPVEEIVWNPIIGGIDDVHRGRIWTWNEVGEAPVHTTGMFLADKTVLGVVVRRIIGKDLVIRAANARYRRG